MKLPQMTGHVKRFACNKTTSFKVTDKKLLKKYTKIWGKVSSLMNKEFHSESVYGGDSDKYIKTKIKIYGENVNTNFHGRNNTKRKYFMSMFVINTARFCH